MFRPEQLQTRGLTYFSAFSIIWVSCLTICSTFLAFNEDALQMALLNLVGGALAWGYLRNRDLWHDYPISTLILGGVAMFFFVLPPMLMAVEGKPLNYNLRDGKFVQLHGLGLFITAIAAQFFYRQSGVLRLLRAIVTLKINQPLGFFTKLTWPQLYAFGFIGLFAALFQVQGGIGASTVESERGILAKVLWVCVPFAYLPYAGFISRRYLSSNSANIGVLPLAAYTALVVAMGISMNSRALIFMALASLALSYTFERVVVSREVSRAVAAKASLVVLLVFVLMPAMKDLGTSVQIVRGNRASDDGLAMIVATIEAMSDKELLRQYRESGAATFDESWDEAYSSNPFLARFSNLKFVDESLFIARDFSEAESEEMRNIEVARAWASIPRPILGFLGVSVDKDFSVGSSGGDLLLYVSTGSPYVLGGFRTGSLSASGYASFGWSYLVLIFVLLLITFPLADSGSTIDPADGRTILSPFIAVSSYIWLVYLTSAASGIESTSTLMVYILRGWLQTPIVAALLLLFVRGIVR